jgi:hypothetical protein
MLAFKEQGQQVGVWVYHLRQNRWEALPAVYPCPARGQIVDAAYDEKNNVVVIHGTHPSGASASLNARQTWTYRYKERANSAAAPRPPRDIVCVTAADGGVKIGWTPAAGAVAARYRIERGVGEQPWLVKWEAAGEVEGGRTEFADAARPKALAFYRAIAVGADGKESRPSLPGRTTPRIVRQVTAVASAAGGVQVRWAAAREADIVGYNVYRAPVDLGSPWSRRFAPESVAETLQRISPAPVAAVEFLDKTARIEGPSDELTWPHTFAYVVRPVNAWGLEGGASPVTLALPDPPGPVQVIPWADGRRLVLWNQCLSGGVEGYCLMRMDDWHSQHVFRLQPAPLLAPGCWDGEEFPTCDRRRYYASGVDALGTLGLPTSGAWSHGFP